MSGTGLGELKAPEVVTGRGRGGDHDHTSLGQFFNVPNLFAWL